MVNICRKLNVKYLSHFEFFHSLKESFTELSVALNGHSQTVRSAVGARLFFLGRAAPLP